MLANGSGEFSGTSRMRKPAAISASPIASRLAPAAGRAGSPPAAARPSRGRAAHAWPRSRDQAGCARDRVQPARRRIGSRRRSRAARRRRERLGIERPRGVELPRMVTSAGPARAGGRRDLGADQQAAEIARPAPSAGISPNRPRVRALNRSCSSSPGGGAGRARGAREPARRRRPVVGLALLHQPAEDAVAGQRRRRPRRSCRWRTG